MLSALSDSARATDLEFTYAGGVLLGLALGIGFRISNIASKLPSWAVVLERSRLTMPGRSGFRSETLSLTLGSPFWYGSLPAVAAIVDLGSSVILSDVSADDDVCCERGVSPSGIGMMEGPWLLPDLL